MLSQKRWKSFVSKKSKKVGPIDTFHWAELYEPVKNGFHDERQKIYPFWEKSKKHLFG